MDQFRSRGFVGGDTLQFEFIGSDLLAIFGEIACRGLIVARVEKYLDVLEGEGWDAYVQTYEYRYNFSVRGRGNILRYDNAHSYPDHADAHHKHTYDWKSGKQLPSSPQWVGYERWPTLGEAIEEVERWYWGNRSNLPNPESFPELELRD